MNTPIPTRAGARLGAGVFFALLLVTLSVVACASTRAGASPPRTPRAAERPAPGGHDLRIRIARSVASIRFDADVISISVPNIRGRISEPGPVTVTREGDNFSITGRDSANPLTFRGPIVLAPPEGGTLR
ncbi:MAG: hypothetical protein H6814_00005, partial [Phycisphaeraceae bacterium]|nr:hypothetical protein [Phycisphaeraceae bacterium]